MCVTSWSLHTHQANNIWVTLKQQHNNIEPLLHHLPLLDHLRHYIGRLQVERSNWDITEPNNIRDLNTRARDFLQQRTLTSLVAHRDLKDESTTSKSTTSSDEVTIQQPQLYIRVIRLQNDTREETNTLGIKEYISKIQEYVLHQRDAQAVAQAKSHQHWTRNWASRTSKRVHQKEAYHQRAQTVRVLHQDEQVQSHRQDPQDGHHRDR